MKTIFKKRTSLLSFIIILSILGVRTFGQTIEGMSGLFRIPTADMSNDKTVQIGISYFDKDIIVFGGKDYNAYSPFVTITYLPSIEISFRITRLIDYPGDDQAIGDRTPSIKIRFKEEDELIPAFVIGMHDLFTVFGGPEAVYNSALYLAASKHYNKWIDHTSIGFHLGYGVDWLDAKNHNFVGFFGGASINAFNIIELLLEYDSTHFNSGVRINLFNHIKLLGGMINNKNFSGGLSFNFSL